MENTNAIDEIKRMAEILSANRTERKAFILMPTFNGFNIYEVSEPLAKHCISAEALRKSAGADSTGKRQSNIPDVINCYTCAFHSFGMLQTPCIGCRDYELWKNK